MRKLGSSNSKVISNNRSISSVASTRLVSWKISLLFNQAGKSLYGKFVGVTGILCLFNFKNCPALSLNTLFLDETETIPVFTPTSKLSPLDFTLKDVPKTDTCPNDVSIIKGTELFSIEKNASPSN